MSWVKVKDSHGKEHLVQKAALEGNFAGHGFVVADEPAPRKKSAKKPPKAVETADDEN